MPPLNWAEPWYTGIAGAGVDDATAGVLLGKERQRQVEDRFLGAGGGDDLRFGIKRDVQSSAGPTRDRLAQTTLADHARILRDGIERIDQRPTHELGCGLDGIADAKIEDLLAAALQVFLDLVQGRGKVRRRGRHGRLS